MSVTAEQVAVGDELPTLEVALDRSFIVASALATRDYEPMHHDPAAARERGLEDIFTNILTSNGLVGRLVTDWTGPAGVLGAIALRLGVPSYAGDALVLTGTVTAKTDVERGCDVEVAVRGSNRLGDHVTATVVVTLPRAS